MTAETTLVARVITTGDARVRVIQPCRVTVERGAQAGVVVEAKAEVFRIGSHESNDPVLNDDTVSKSHLEVQVVRDGYQAARAAGVERRYFQRLLKQHGISASTLEKG